MTSWILLELYLTTPIMEEVRYLDKMANKNKTK